MGTGTFVNQHERSQSRKTRSASTKEPREGEILSPLEVIHGNIVTCSSTIQSTQMRKSSRINGSSEKENAPPASNGLLDGRAPQVLLNEGVANPEGSKSIKKKKDSGTKSYPRKRLRNRPGGSDDNFQAIHGGGNTASPVVTDGEDEKEPASTRLRDGKASQVLLNDGVTNPASSQAITQNKLSGTKSSPRKRLRNSPGCSEDNFQATHTGENTASPVLTDGENEKEPASTGSRKVKASQVVLNEGLSNPAGSQAITKSKGSGTRSYTRKQPGNTPGCSEDNVQANLAGGCYASPVVIEIDGGENGKELSVAGRHDSSPCCTGNAGQEVAPAPPQPENYDLQAPVSHRRDSKDKDHLETTDVYQNMAGSLACTNPLVLLQKDYDKIYKKYQKLKVRKIDEVEALYEEQRSRIAAYVKATEALMDHYKRENDSLKKQIQEADMPQILDRCRWLEKANVECRNDLVMERSKNLELRQEVRKLESLLLEQGAAKGKNSETDPKPLPEPFVDLTLDIRNRDETILVLSSQLKLLQQLLERLLGLKLNLKNDGSAAQLEFVHGPTGFSFNLQSVHDMDIAQLVGGGELMYQVVSLGTLCKKAHDWMKEEEAIFGLAQAQLIFKRLLRFVQNGA